MPHLTLQNVQFPVALFLDGHRSHLGIDVMKFCLKSEIILVCLYPNSTRKGQPLDLTVNRQVQREFAKAKENFFIAKNYLTLVDHPGVLRTALNTALQPEYAKQGFFSAGLYPYSFDNVNTSDMFARDRTKV